nr:F-box protein At4g00755-like isoform X1 [Nicotiana tomentosiformis]
MMWHQFPWISQSLIQKVDAIVSLDAIVFYLNKYIDGLLIYLQWLRLSKQLCLRKFPQLSRISRIREPDLGIAEGKDVKFSNSTWETLKIDHNVYASLLQAIETSNSCPSDCIDYEVSASSTDDYPVSVWNTLVPTDRNQDQPSYWSSTGDSDPNAPETLIYKLKADLCVITEINIQPLEVYSHPGRAICCPKSVRFRLGHPKSSRDKRRLLHWHPDQPADDKFIWTYTSEEFLMRQETRLQPFKLPEPVLCIGGYLQIELLGRALRCDIDDLFIDGLFYICIRHVKVRGRPFTPALDAHIIRPSGDFVLEYNRDNVF